MPDDAPAAVALAAEVERRVPAISRRVIEEMYQDPFWQERFGDRGRRHAGEDGDYHVRYLAEAVRTGSTAVMVTYARWLRTVLTSRGMCTRHLADNFARLAAAVATEDLPGRTTLIDILVAAEACLLYEASGPRAIQERAATLASEATARLEARRPEWGPGTPARDRAPEDALTLLSYLADAVAAAHWDSFSGYVRFLAGSFVRRGVPADYLSELIDVLTGVVREAGPAVGEGLPILQASRWVVRADVPA